jgi:O-antigen ligase
VGVAVVSGAALALSQSATAVLGVAAALALVAVMHGYRARAAYFWAFVTIAPYAVVLTVAASYWREVLGWFGKDSTLTGRLSIWSDAIAAIGERPVTGYGYAAYWPWKFAEEGAGPALVAITNPHNLLLHFMLAFGVLGLVLPVAVLVAAVRPPGSAPDPGRWLTIGLIAFVALQGITEASALEPRTIGLFVVVVALTRNLER